MNSLFRWKIRLVDALLKQVTDWFTQGVRAKLQHTIRDLVNAHSLRSIKKRKNLENIVNSNWDFIAYGSIRR